MRGRRLQPRDLRELRLQASLQVAGRTARKHHLLPYEARGGFALLPEPDGGDVYFDMEGDPFFAPARARVSIRRVPRRGPLRCRSRARPQGRKAGDEEFLDFVVERRSRFPKLHVYHYAPYEETALRRLTSATDARSARSTTAARGRARRSVRSCAKAARFVRELFDQEDRAILRVQAQCRRSARRRFDRGVRTVPRNGDERFWTTSSEYNRDDCRSTLRVAPLALEKRVEAEAAGEAMPWTARSPAPSRKRNRRPRNAMVELRNAILDWLRPPSTAPTRRRLPTARAALAARQLLDYHRREAKPEWWRFYSACENVEELVEIRSRLRRAARRADIRDRSRRRSSSSTRTLSTAAAQTARGMPCSTPTPARAPARSSRSTTRVARLS